MKTGDLVIWESLSLRGMVLGFEGPFVKVLWLGSSQPAMIKRRVLKTIKIF